MIANIFMIVELYLPHYVENNHILFFKLLHNILGNDNSKKYLQMLTSGNSFNENDIYFKHI